MGLRGWFRSMFGGAPQSEPVNRFAGVEREEIYDEFGNWAGFRVIGDVSPVTGMSRMVSTGAEASGLAINVPGMPEQTRYYDRQGNFEGTAMDVVPGMTSHRDPSGHVQGTSFVNGVGQRVFYDSQGNFQGFQMENAVGFQTLYNPSGQVQQTAQPLAGGFAPSVPFNPFGPKG